MYNRYIPQSDGTFQRSRIEENIPDPKKNKPMSAKPSPKKEEPNSKPPEQHVHFPPQRPCTQRPTCTATQKKHPRIDQQTTSIPSFLKQLLPKNFDTSDLMIILLLLIMSGECAEDQNTALLTLVLYLFL